MYNAFTILTFGHLNHFHRQPPFPVASRFHRDIPPLGAVERMPNRALLESSQQQQQRRMLRSSTPCPASLARPLPSPRHQQQSIILYFTKMSFKFYYFLVLNGKNYPFIWVMVGLLATQCLLK